MFGYRLKWNFLIRNILCLAFNRLSPTTNFFCHRSFYRFSCRAHGLANLLAIDRLINTTNLLTTNLAFLKKAFFIGVTIGIRYILCFIWKDYRFCLCYRPFRNLIGWILRLNGSFSHMAFFLCPLGFHHTCIGWVLWLNRSFADMAFFLGSLGCYNWRRNGLRGWLGIFLCPDSKNLWNWFFGDLAFNDSANFLSIYHTDFRQYGPLSILASCQHLGLPFR